MPIRTSASQIKQLLAKTGRYLLMSEQYEKHEAIVELVERINNNVGKGSKMEINLSDLNDFLSREGIEEQSDIKGCVSQLIQFVHSQLERLAQYAQTQVDKAKKQEHADKVLHDLLKLWGMEYQEVEKCFAIEVYSPKRDLDAEVKDRGLTDAKRRRICDRVGDEGKRDSAPEMAGAIEDKQDDALDMSLAIIPGGNEGKRDIAPEMARAIEDKQNNASDMALAIVPRQTRLVEDLKRLVPASVLAIEDGSIGGSSEDRSALAKAEIERILKASWEGTPILLGDTVDKRRQAFRAIIRLLHPEVGLVAADDAAAMQALDLSLRAFMKSELSED